MISIGIRNLINDKLRTAVAVLGVTFAVMLLTTEIGMLLGLVENASLLIDNSKADIWVMKVNVATFDFSSPIDRRNKHLIESISGVDYVEEYNVAYGAWQLPEGGIANVLIVAFNQESELAAPLRMTEGSIDSLHNQDTIIIDNGERIKLGGVNIGDTVEVVDRRAKVVGFTQGMRSFTTTPYIFTSLRRGDKYSFLTTDSAGKPSSMYFLVKTTPGADVSAICADIEQSIDGLMALPRERFSWKTRKYWLIETGVGVGFIVGAFLGLLVGGVILSQSLYAMTLEKLPEFGVMKAMGATMYELARPVLEQGLICGLFGLLIGLSVAFCLQRRSEERRVGNGCRSRWRPIQ